MTTQAQRVLHGQHQHPSDTVQKLISCSLICLFDTIYLSPGNIGPTICPPVLDPNLNVFIISFDTFDHYLFEFVNKF